MLSVSAMGVGKGSYYLALAREDYYLEGGEPLGRWWGAGSEQLRLKGAVLPDQLQALLNGLDPHGTKKPLVQLQKAERRSKHAPGWDLTFSTPKSVSVFWAVADSDTRSKIQQAHHRAVESALQYLQDEASITRRGKGGVLAEPARLVVATFEHGTSRAQDPELHTHALVMNVAGREDGTMGTLASKPLYQHKMAAGAIYRMALSTELQKQLGVSCERDRWSFRLRGVPEDLCKELSKRSEAIKAELKSYRSSSAAAAAAAALRTRPWKVHRPRAELFREWRETAAKHAFELGLSLIYRSQPRVNDVRTFNKVLKDSVTQITSSDSTFTRKQLLRTIAVNAQGQNLTASFVRAQLTERLRRGGEIISIATLRGEQHYTTKEVLKAEEKLLQTAERLARQSVHGAHEKIIEKGLGRSGGHLNDEQYRAVHHITAKGASIRCVEGWAGTGKTRMLATAKEIWEAAGYRVVGTTLSAKAARELHQGAHIESFTIKKLSLKMNPSIAFQLRYHLRQLWRAALKKPTFKLNRFDLGAKKTVLVIDEAAMVDTKELGRLVAAVEKSGGMTVLSFDRRQVQAIGRGGAPAAIADRFGKVELNEIVRQKDARDVQNVKDLALGNAEHVLADMAKRGKLAIEKDRESAKNKLVSDWLNNEKGQRASSLIFVGTREEVSDLNRRCQAARRDAGELGRIVIGGFQPNDRIVFTKNSKTIGVDNGDFGTIVSVNRLMRTVTVRLDRGETVIFSPSRFKGAQLGYAVTTHKGQGTTVDNAYLLAGGKMQSRELTYVQASRAKFSTHVYVDRAEAGKKLELLAKQMNQSQEKKLAHDVFKEDREMERKRDDAALQLLLHLRRT